MTIQSALFYMGNKYDLIDILKLYFPKKADIFIDLFGGSGTVTANVFNYDEIIYNEINTNIYNLVSIFKDENKILEYIDQVLNIYDLPKDYDKFRNHYNKNRKIEDLYILTYYSFCNLIRFNKNNDFNMPVGNQKFNKTEHSIKILKFQESIRRENVFLQNKDAFKVLEEIKETNGKEIFIYLDPPYLNTTAIYNENRAFGGWNMDDDIKLLNELERLDKMGVKFALSNVLQNKGKNNQHLEKWALKNNYKIIYIDNKTYSSLGKGNAKSVEVLIVNYEPPFEQLSLFD